MTKDEYTLVRVYHNDDTCRVDAEFIGCKSLQEAIDLGTCLSDEERYFGSHIIDNVRHCQLTLKGEGYHF